MTFPIRFPRQFGRPLIDVDEIHEAILDELRPGWDTSEGTELWAETRAEAYAVTMCWMLNARLAGQMSANRMLDNLVDWEAACQLRPGPRDSLRSRRRRLAARMRGYVGNAIDDIAGVAAEAVGAAHFVGLVSGPESAIWYMPGVKPGPPGREWFSTHAIVCAHISAGNKSLAQQLELIAAARSAMSAMCPAWMVCNAAIGPGYGGALVGDVGIVGVTAL